MKSRITSPLIACGFLALSIVTGVVSWLAFQSHSGMNTVVLSSTTSDKELGNLEGSRKIHLTFEVAGFHFPGIESYIRNLRDPKSEIYGKYLNPKSFADKFGPSESEYARLVSLIDSSGLEVEKTYPDRALVQASGTIAQIEKIFGVEMHEYQKGERKYFAPAGAYVLPQAFTGLVAGVSGLSGWMSGRVENYQFAGSGLSPAQLAGALTPDQIKKIYGMDSIQEDGSGQTIAILDFDGFLDSDITMYLSKFNIQNPAPREVVPVDGFSGTPTGNSGQGETTLDIEMVYAMAPHVKKILIYEVPYTSAANGIPHLLAAAANDNRAQIVSVSLGSPEPKADPSIVSLENTLLMQFATQGSTVLIASGDSGAYAGTTGSVAVANPAAQPYATAVGGTSVRYTSDFVYTSETSWANSANTRGGGGGISTVWPLPDWQAGLGTAANLGSSAHRMIPDISINGDGLVPYYYTLKGAQGTATGGTSFAAPLWAGYLALVNQRRLANGLPNLGFITPTIYQIARSSIYNSVFHDVNDGSTNLFYPTTPGYDLSSGWGSPKGEALMEILTGPILPPAAPKNFTAEIVAD